MDWTIFAEGNLSRSNNVQCIEKNKVWNNRGCRINFQDKKYCPQGDKKGNQTKVLKGKLGFRSVS